MVRRAAASTRGLPRPFSAPTFARASFSAAATAIARTKGGTGDICSVYRGCKMKNLSPDDRPREKLRSHGTAALGDNELVALVIWQGSRRGDALTVANTLLAAHGGLHG